MKASVISRSETWFFLSAYWREEGRWGFWLNLQNNYCDEIWSLIFTKNMKILLEILCAFSFLILWFSSKEKLECFGLFWFYANSMLAVRITYMGTIYFFCVVHSLPLLLSRRSCDTTECLGTDAHEQHWWAATSWL